MAHSVVKQLLNTEIKKIAANSSFMALYADFSFNTKHRKITIQDISHAWEEELLSIFSTNSRQSPPFFSLSLYLFLWLCHSLSSPVNLCLSASMFVTVCLLVMSMYIRLSLSMPACLSLFVCLYVCHCLPSISACLFVFVYPSRLRRIIHLLNESSSITSITSVVLSFFLSLYLFLCLCHLVSSFVSDFLSVCLSVCPFVFVYL